VGLVVPIQLEMLVVLVVVEVTLLLQVVQETLHLHPHLREILAELQVIPLLQAEEVERVERALPGT
jgi:hypothetical protein